MSAAHAVHIVEGYIARLEDALAEHDPARRRELVEDVRAHFADARASLGREETDEDLLAIVDRLGDPAEIAGEPRRNGSRESARWGLLEVAAVLLTFFAWPAGVLLASLSSVWSYREKLIGTLIGAAALVIGFPPLAPIVAPVLGPLVTSPSGAIVMGTLAALPLFSAVWFATRLRRRPSALGPLAL